MFLSVLRGVCCLMLLFACAPLLAADKFSKGDEVEALVMGAWLPGKVESIDRRGFVSVRLEAGGQSKSEAFKPADLRFAWESGALSRARLWTDATGKFRIKAVLLSVAGDEVTLRKPDMTEVKLPTDKLSATDRKLVAELAKASPMKLAPMPPPQTTASRPAIVNKTPPLLSGVVAEPELRGTKPEPPATPEPATFDTTKAVVVKDVVGKYAALEADGRAELQFPQAGVSVARRDIVERCQSLLAVGPIDGKGMWTLTTLVSNGKPPRLLWSSLPEQQLHEQSLPTGEIVLDYHAASHRLLTLSGEQYGAQRPPRLTVWEVTPTDVAPKSIACWLAPTKFDIHVNLPWGRFVTADLVVHRGDEKVWTAWDIAKKQAAFRIEQDANKDVYAVLSPGRRYLGIAALDGVNLYEAATGKLLSTVALDSQPRSIGFNRAGDRLMVAEVSRLTEWDLTKAQSPPQVYKPSQATLKPRVELTLDEERILVFDTANTVHVYSRKLQREVWAFTTSSLGKSVVDGQILYSHGLNQNKGTMLGCVTVPQSFLASVETKVADAVPVVDRGQAVKVVCDVGLDSASVKAMLEKKAVENGWKLSDAATTVITAKRIDSPPKQATYEGFEGTKFVRQSVTVHPVMLLINIEVDGRHVWGNGKSSGNLPSTITRLKPGETVQSLVDQEAKPTNVFFEELKIPAQISIEGAFGHSALGSEGIGVPMWR